MRSSRPCRGRSASGTTDGAVGLLVVLENREPGAANGEAAAVECVHEFGLLFAGGLEADVGAASLEGFEVGAGGDFAIELLAGEPDFEVEGLGGREAHVAGAEQDAAVGKLEGFEDLFGVAGELLVLGVGFFGARELDQLDLLKLVLADDAAHVFAGGSGFGAEAGRVGGEADGQPGFVEDFVAIEIGDGDFGGGDEPVVVVPEVAAWRRLRLGVGAAEEVFGELGKLAGAEEALAN